MGVRADSQNLVLLEKYKNKLINMSNLDISKSFKSSLVEPLENVIEQ